MDRAPTTLSYIYILTKNVLIWPYTKGNLQSGYGVKMTCLKRWIDSKNFEYKSTKKACKHPNLNINIFIKNQGRFYHASNEIITS